MLTSQNASLALALALFVANAQADSRPNIVFILADDLSPFALAAYGNDTCDTPNIDRLAAEGMVFHGAHHMGSWSGAVCTPSRTMIMTGRTVWRIPGAVGTPFQRNAEFRRAAAQQSMPAVFNSAGFDTFRTCKKGNSYPEANELFDESAIAGFEMRQDPRNSNWHGDRAIEYLHARQENGDADPFLLYFGFTHPHDPRYGIPELLEKYGAVNEGELTEPNPKAPPLPISYLPAHPFHHGHPGLRDEEHVQGVMTRRDEATVRNELGREYACIENIDRQIGRVLEKLEAMGELENTYIFFTADHGIAVGRHGLMGKQNLYEHTWRVPLIVRGPGVQPGSETNAMVYLLDLLPTFCELTNTPIPSAVEGDSFAGVLHGRADMARDVVYGVYAGGTKPGIRSVKTKRWKLIKYDTLDGAVQQTQLFDLQTNPRELLAEHHTAELQAQLSNRPAEEQVDLAKDPAYADQRADLERLLAQQQRELGDPFLHLKSDVNANSYPTTIDLNDDQGRQIVVDRETAQYLGHPTTCLLEDGKTILCVYPKGHGRGAIVYKRSDDGGLTWSERLPTPASWATSQEVPTLHRVIGPDGKKRIIMWSGLYPARLAVTEDDGATWSELAPAGDWGGIVVMGCVEPLQSGAGHYLAMFHDDGRFFTKDGERTDTFTLYKTFSTNGGLTWSFPQEVYKSSQVHLCEPGCIRSPDGQTLAVLLRENARRRRSHVMFSSDEGQTWSPPREVPLSLTGDRHTGKYGPDGRLFISFRCISPKHLASGRPFDGDWVGWVGTWEDIARGGAGQYVVRLKDNTKPYDTAYPGVEVLPDGTFVTTTYGHWSNGEEPYILSVRFTLDQLDALAR